MSQSEPSGNTKSAWQSTQYYNWAFTLKVTEERTAYNVATSLKNVETKNFTFQKEQGNEKTKYIHWQGCFSLVNKERLKTLKNHLGFHDIHLEPARNYFSLENYCQKDETRIEGPYTHESIFIDVIQPNYWWQKKLLAEICVPCTDDRKIIWYCDFDGNSGKTVLAKYACICLGMTYLTNAKCADIAYSLPENPNCVIFDLCRSNEEHINYQVLESIKNGIVFSPKYKSKLKVFKPPHVVIFANFMPDIKKLSIDRWDIRTNLSKVDFSNELINEEE